MSKDSTRKRRRPPTTSHNYLPKLVEMQTIWQAAGLLPSGFVQLEIAHDRWCDVYRGREHFCNCDPEITIRDGKISRYEMRIVG